MTAEGRRPRRVAEGIREHLGMVLVSELSDPRFAQLVVTRVSITPDLGCADVQVRLLSGGASERARDRTLAALRKASGRLRRGLGERLRIKRMPELRFFYDMAPEARARVDELLDEIAQESKPLPEAPQAGESGEERGDDLAEERGDDLAAERGDDLAEELQRPSVPNGPSTKP